MKTLNFANPVIPGHEDKQTVIDGPIKGQYTPLAVVVSPCQGIPLLFRLELTPEARKSISEGSDIIFAQLTGGQHFQPVSCAVFNPQVKEEVDAVLEAYDIAK